MRGPVRSINFLPWIIVVVMGKAENRKFLFENVENTQNVNFLENVEFIFDKRVLMYVRITVLY